MCSTRPVLMHVFVGALECLKLEQHGTERSCQQAEEEKFATTIPSQSF